MNTLERNTERSFFKQLPMILPSVVKRTTLEQVKGTELISEYSGNWDHWEQLTVGLLLPGVCSAIVLQKFLDEEVDLKQPPPTYGLLIRWLFPPRSTAT